MGIGIKEATLRCQVIKVLFFAKIREQLKTSEIVVNENPETVGELRKLLWLNGPDWKSNLSNDTSLVAVNQSLRDDLMPLKQGDEVAFFPPVTGG